MDREDYFFYRIAAKRRGYENLRLEEFKEPKKSPEETKLPLERKEAEVKQPKRPFLTLKWKFKYLTRVHIHPFRRTSRW